MKKIAMTLVALLTMSAAMAQSENKEFGNDQKDCCKDKKECCEKKGRKGMMPRKPMTAAERTEMMAKKLNLTAEQKTKVLALMEKKDADMKAKFEKKKEAK